MATQAQCAYCFETISARLEGGRKQLSLAQLEELWEIYEHGEEEDGAAAQLKAESAQADAAREDDEMEDEAEAPTQTRTSPYRPAAISRLLNPSPASSSSASSTSPSAASSTPSLSSNTSKTSSRTSIFSLSNRFTRGRKTSSTTELDADVEEYPLFVTWNKVEGGHKRLAGCIGTFEPYELEEGLNIYSRTAAFEDDRFEHIRLRDLPILSCAITLLMHFESISNPMDWTIGTHGLRISFVYQGRRLGATYLPDVAREQGWTKEETIVSLMRKAGWSGRSSEWRGVRDLSCVRYQGMKASLGYREWKEFRSWVEETGREESELEV